MLKKIATIIKLFRIQATLAMNSFIFFPLLVKTQDFWFSFINTLPFILMISGEIALNDCCDIEKDRINKPQRPLVSEEANIPKVLIIVGIVLLISIILAIIFYNSCIIRLIVFLLVLLILSLYNLPLKGISIFKSIITAICTVLCLFFVNTYLKTSNQYYFFLFSAFLFIIARELFLDVRDINGDKKNNYRTIAVIFGKKKTDKLAIIILFCSNIFNYIYVFSFFSIINVLLFIIQVLLEIGIIILYLRSKDNKEQNKAMILLWLPMLLMLIILINSLM